MTQQMKWFLENNAPMKLSEILEEEIESFLKSETYARMAEAEQYYRNRSDVQRKTNELAKRSNTRMEHPILKKLVDQKADYLLAKPFSVRTEDDWYGEALNELFDASFRRKIHSLGKGAVRDGIAYLAPWFNDRGKLCFMRLPSTEVIPLWKDAAHEELDGYIRFYEQVVYEGRHPKKIRRVEYWNPEGVQYFKTSGENSTRLIPDSDNGPSKRPHFVVEKTSYNWLNVPLFWLKYNEEELPLCYYIKELIDDLNWQSSVTADLLRDVSKFIYILRGYGGADLGEFVSDLKKYLAVKVDGDGGVEKLQANLDMDAVMAFLEKDRRDIYDYAGGVDTQDKELGNASGVAIHFRYMGLDNDCAALGNGLQETFQQMKPFIDTYFQILDKGNFSTEQFSVVFNTDMPVNETDVIANAQASVGMISRRTVLENHPWVKNVEEEMVMLERDGEEKSEE